MRVPILTFLLLLLAADVSSASPVDTPDNSGTAFYDQCAAVEREPSELSSTDVMLRNYCLGYVAGLTQGAHAAEEIHSVTWIFCLPQGVTNVQRVRVIRKYISNHPEEAHNPAEGLALQALREAFPCGAR